MAWIVADSFDYYGSNSDLAHSVWDSVPLAPALSSATRFNSGQSAVTNSGNGVYLQKTVPSNEATLFVALAYFRGGALSGNSPEMYIQFSDGANAQCTIAFESGGNITLRSGGPTGTVLATYAAAYPQDTWTHFQCRVVIDGAAGTFTVRKNGSPTDSFAATGLNTRGGSANNYANVVQWGNNSGGFSNRVDDLLFFSGSGAAPNTWVGDVRAICLPACGDTAQKQFASSLGATLYTVGPTGGPAGSVPVQANIVIFPNVSTVLAKGGLLTKLTMTFSAGVTGHVQMAVYLNDGVGGIPGTLLGTSTAVTNPGTGAVDFAFTGVPLAAGRSYYFPLLCDVAWTTTQGSGSPRYELARAYASGFPNPAGTLTTNASNSSVYATATLSGNTLAVGELLANGDTDYVFDSTVGDTDLYDLDNLTVTPAAILGVVSRAYVKKSDAGARNGQLQVVSGATTVTGVDTLLSSTWGYLARVDTVDPATAAAWTLTAVNALKVGQKVTA